MTSNGHVSRTKSSNAVCRPPSSVLIITNTRVEVKLPAHRAGLPGNEISFFIVPLDSAYKAGLAGHVPVKVQRWESQENGKNEL
jgi:hypothetical protein